LYLTSSPNVVNLLILITPHNDTHLTHVSPILIPSLFDCLTLSIFPLRPPSIFLPLHTLFVNHPLRVHIQPVLVSVTPH
jgi:hypothetical protein